MDRASEAALVSRAKKGEHRAFEELIRPVREQVYRRSLSATKNHSQADDIAQETVIRAYTKLDSFRGDSKFSTWVYSICQRCILMHFRSQKRKRADSIEEYDSAHMEAVITRNSPALPGQEEVAIVNQRLDSIDCAMKEIDPKYAEVITLWVQGNTLSQIRDVTDLTVSAAKTRIHRARNKIRNLLEAA